MKFRDWSPVQTVVEANVCQAAQVDELRRTTAVRVKPVVTVKDKVTRFLKLAARFEAGSVFIRPGVMEDLVEQLLLAPEGAHDDLIDALDLGVGVAVDGYFEPWPEGLTLFKIDARPNWRDAEYGRVVRGPWRER